MIINKNKKLLIYFILFFTIKNLFLIFVIDKENHTKYKKFNFYLREMSRGTLMALSHSLFN